MLNGLEQGRGKQYWENYEPIVRASTSSIVPPVSPLVEPAMREDVLSVLGSMRIDVQATGDMLWEQLQERSQRLERYLENNDPNRSILREVLEEFK